MTFFEGVDRTENQETFAVKLFIMKSLHFKLPVIIYNKWNLELVRQISDMGFELNSPSVTKGYLVISQSSRLISDNLKIMSQINANGRWIFVIINAKISEIKSMLIDAWSDFKMINNLVLLIDWNQQQLMVISYNPFTEQEKFWIEKVSMKTIADISACTTNLLNKKIKDLQGFTLNFTMFESESTATPIKDTKGNIVRYGDLEGEMASMFG